MLALAVVFPGHDPSRFAVGPFQLNQALDYSYDGPAAFFERFREGRTVLAYADEPEGTFAVVENPRLGEALAERFPALARSILATPGALGAGEAPPRSILINGKADSSTYYDRETLRLAAHLPALFAPRRAKALVIGLGTGVTAGELALHPDVESIVVAEIAPGVARLLPHFAEATHDVHRDPRLEIRLGDAFRILRRSEGRYDLIVSEPSNPWTAGSAQLFSREFQRLVRERLAEDGVFLQWIQTYATTDAITAIVVNTLRAELPYVHAFTAGADVLLLASRAPLADDTLSRVDDLLAERPAVRDSLAAIGVHDLDDLLLRDHPATLELADALAHLGLETLDRPRIQDLAAAAAFGMMGSSLDLRPTPGLSGRKSRPDPFFRR
jgi:spermidine synthase